MILPQINKQTLSKFNCMIKSRPLSTSVVTLLARPIRQHIPEIHSTDFRANKRLNSVNVVTETKTDDDRVDGSVVDWILVLCQLISRPRGQATSFSTNTHGQ